MTTQPRAEAAHPPVPSGSPAGRGQVLVIFALSIVLFVGLCGVVLDIAWYWANDLRMQRASDAAALAGVVYLPGDEVSAIAAAKAEASKNGFTDGTGGVTVTAGKDPANARSLDVAVRGGIGTFFMRLFGIASMPANTASQAEYVLPVPMGSPEAYYGVFGPIRTPSGGTASESSNWISPTANSGSVWTNPGNAWTASDGNAVATSTGSSTQAWTGFSIPAPGAGTVVITGIEVSVSARGNAATGCTLNAAIYRKSGTQWSSSSETAALTGTLAPYSMGGPTDLWGLTGWTTADFTSANAFALRLWNTGSGSCTLASVDSISVRLDWTRTSTTIPAANLAGPNNETLNPRGFWGAMLSQGAESMNGDAFMPYYDTRTSATNAAYNPTQYYNYAVEMPPGSANGTIWIFDPVFCATENSGKYGTGDRYFSGNAAVSAFYTIWDTQGTPYDLTDDTLVGTSGTLFRGIQASDQTLNGPSGLSSCATGDVTDPTDGRYWHNRWWPLATGLSGGTDGRTYRVNTTSTDPNSSAAQLSADAQNNFALFASATGGTPTVNGIGTMESFSPLAGGTTSEFYLAQIDAVHAGKTVVINLWDPGDTNGLTANLQILIPGTTGYTPATVTWSSKKGTTNTGASNCNGRTGSGTSITTYTTSSQFNGCWVTISIPIPGTYTAPIPPGETEPGWWKIRYVMGGTSSTVAFDVTTWQVTIRGNPVHLVLP
jgi:hypothetical protein